MRNILLLSFSLFLSITVNAQEEQKVRHWRLIFSMGKSNITTSGLNKGYIMDDLVNYRKEANAHYQFGAGYYFKNWGLESIFTYTKYERNSKFTQIVTNTYSANYYITKVLEFQDHDNDNYNKICIGPVYQFKWKKMVIIPKFMLGVAFISLDSAHIILKEINTNKNIKISWSANTTDKSYTTYNPSITIGYQLSKRFCLNLDINYWYWNTKFKYTETILDLISNDISTTEYHYNGAIREISIGLGLSFLL